MTRLLPPLSIPVSTPIYHRERLKRIDRLATRIALILLADNPPERLHKRAAQYRKDGLHWLADFEDGLARNLEFDPRFEVANRWHATTKDGTRKFLISIYRGMVRNAALRAKQERGKAA